MKKLEGITEKELQMDLDKSYISPADMDYLHDLASRITAKSTGPLKELNGKKKKHLTSKVSKSEWNTKASNEIFWDNKNEIQTARKAAGFDPIKIQVKTCLSCAGKFESEGKHNRLCDDCRAENGL